MKKLVTALLVLPFVFSCNRIDDKILGGAYADKLGGDADKYKSGIVKVEIEHGDFSGELVLPHINISLVNLSEESLDGVEILGSDRFKKTVDTTYWTNRIRTQIVSLRNSTEYIPLKKTLVYETSKKVNSFSLSYTIDYKDTDNSRFDQEIPIKAKLYLDGKLQHEASSVYRLSKNEFDKMKIFSMVYVNYIVNSVDGFDFKTDLLPKD